MMLKANGEYLDFNGDIEIEKKIKLFEDIETADGDLSFAFEIDLTSNNLRILNIPVPDSTSKTVYQNTPCEVQNNQGITINIGSLRIERVIGYKASCSFLGGNSNWFAMLDGDMTELRLSHYDVEQNDTTIPASWFNTEGIVYPFLDLGAMVTRSYINAKTEDFVGSFYLHTLFKEVFLQSGLKIKGELLNDSLFNQIVVVTNTRNKSEIDDRKTYAGSSGTQALTGSAAKITIITNDSTGKFYDGAQDNYDAPNSRYTADVKMILNVNVSMTIDQDPGILLIYKNGIQQKVITVLTSGSVSKTFYLNAGDYIEAYGRLLFAGSSNITNAEITVDPKFIYNTTGIGAVPLWTKQQFVSNVMKAFNLITSYNQFTKTVTFNFFDKIKTKQSIDLSEYISVNEIDYSEFISNYAQVNNFSYQESDDEDLRVYNISKFIKYGSGQILANNYYAEKTADVIELDFTSPISYQNPAFGCSLEKINFVELEDDDPQNVSSVTDASGIPRFNISNADDFYQENDLVRIETDADDYNGEYVITNVASSYITVRGLNYSASATGTVTRLFHSVTTDDNVYWLINIPRRTASEMMPHSGAYLDQGFSSSWTLAFFNLIALGMQIEEEYKQGLSFGSIDDPSSFQKTLIDKYWQQFERILNDPVKLLTTGNLPWKVYNSLDFLSPVSITTKESSNLYYVNKITGYKDSSIGCEVDLIKLP